MPSPRLRVPVILGPTGIGKSRAALEVARRLNGEIVVADSRQLYRELDIATNKPRPAERATVMYHLINVADPRQTFTVHDFVAAATASIASIADRGGLPIIEGGSMLYVDALCDGLSLARVPPQPGLRQELASLSLDQLRERLEGLDPRAEVDRRNRVRVVRAIEILEIAGPPLARHRTRHPPAWEAIRIGLTASDAVITSRLAARSLQQLDRGLIEETRRALDAGVDRGAPVLTGIGYKEAVGFLRGEISAADLVAVMTRANRRLARRQLRWLRADPRVRWFEAEPDPVPAILDYLETKLA